MSLSVSVRPDLEHRIRDSARAEGVPPEKFAARRLEEAELLWSIRSAVPVTETRELHRLLRKQKSRGLSESESRELSQLLDDREARAAERLEHLSQLSMLSGIPLRKLMDDLGIAPIQSPR